MTFCDDVISFSTIAALLGLGTTAPDGMAVRLQLFLSMIFRNTVADRSGPCCRGRLSQTSFAQTFSALLKFYRRKCGACRKWNVVFFFLRRAAKASLALQPLLQLEDIVRHDRRDQHQDERKRIAVGPFQLRHDLEVHAVDRGDQGW